jgi:formylglycine-generating enzyme required for sulfatase activity
VQTARFQVVNDRSTLEQGIRGFVFTPDGKTCIMLTAKFGQVRMKGEFPMFLEWWNLETGTQTKSIALPPSSLEFHALAISNDGNTLALKAAQLHQKTWNFFELRDASSGDFLREIPVDVEDLNYAHHIKNDKMIFTRDDKSLVMLGATRDPSSDITEWDIADGLRTRLVAGVGSHCLLEQAAQKVVVVNVFNDPRIKPDDGVNFRIDDLAKLPWKDDPKLEANRARAAAAKAVKPSFGPEDKEISNSLGMKLVALPQGQMETGLPVGQTRGVETARYFVRINRPIMIATCPVTVGQFAQFIAEVYKSKETRRNPGFAQTDTHPVVLVNLGDAVAFCDWLSKKERRHYRLPSVLEWEYVVRVGTTARSFMDASERALTDFAWIADNSDKRTHPVGEKKPNPWGLFDLLGNVTELCVGDNVDGRRKIFALGYSWASKPFEYRTDSLPGMILTESASNAETGFRVLLDSQ